MRVCKEKSPAKPGPIMLLDQSSDQRKAAERHFSAKLQVPLQVTLPPASDGVIEQVPLAILELAFLP